jgi:hypothetical protein
VIVLGRAILVNIRHFLIFQMTASVEILIEALVSAVSLGKTPFWLFCGGLV